MIEIKDWVDFITKGLLRVFFGLFLFFGGLSLNNFSKRPIEQKVYEYPKEYNSNETKYEEEVKDKIIEYYRSLPPNDRNHFLDSLSREYERRNLP